MGLIFLVALLFFFWRSYSSMEKSNKVYSAIEEPTLPIVFAEMNGYQMNPMHAYLQEMGNNAARDMLTVLPENRNLNLNIIEYDNMVMSVKYEIRSLDLSHLIENKTITNIKRANGVAKVTLPIENLIDKDKEYLLKITMDTGEQRLKYYTRIVWTDHDYTKQMEDLALNFTTSTFDKHQAKNLSVYLESKQTADNSSLNHVTLNSSFQQLTWGDTGMQPDGDYYMTLKEFDGVMGEIQIQYKSKALDENGVEKSFLNENNFIFRYDPSRIYIMAFDRTTNEIFDGITTRFNGKKVQLGIEGEKEIRAVSSENKQFVGLEINKDLWCYNKNDKQKIKNIFSYRSSKDDGSRSNYNEHNLKILNVKDNGDVDFLVYGYINRGKHEGYNGVIYYTYDAKEDTVIENFFIMLPDTYEKIEYYLERLAYLSNDGMLYIYYNGGIYGIDTNSYEVVTVVSGLENSEFASAKDGRYIAYQDPDAETEFKSRKITFVDLSKNKSTDITAGGKNLKVLGFIGNDLIYGMINPQLSDTYTDSGDIPTDEIHIVGPDLAERTKYSKDGLLLTDIEVSGTRIYLNEVKYDAQNNQYQKVGKDTIISNRTEEKNDEILSTENQKTFKKIWIMNIPDIQDKKVKASVPRHLSVEKTSSIDLNFKKNSDKNAEFSAYAYGHFVGFSRTLVGAYNMISDKGGYIVDQNQNLVFNRNDKKPIVSIKNPADKISVIEEKLPELKIINTYEDFIMINANGMDLNSALYYLNKGYPLVAYLGNNYQYIVSYDQFNIKVMNPTDGTTQLIGKDDADAMYKQDGYHFVAVLPNNNG